MKNEYVHDMKCQNCGADIHLDLDNLIAFCPYCGAKLLVDPIAFKEVLVEKERTKRVAMKYDHEKEVYAASEKRNKKIVKLKIVIGSIGAICVFIGCAGATVLPGLSSTGFLMVGMIAFIALMAMGDSAKGGK